MKSGCCVICYRSTKLISSSSKLESQLNVIFILKKVFGLKFEQLTVNLRKWGNPGEWVNLCEKCEEEVVDLRNMYSRLHDLSRKYSKAIGSIKEKVRTSEKNKPVKHGLAVNEFVKECRNRFRRCQGASGSGKVPSLRRHGNPKTKTTASKKNFNVEIETVDIADDEKEKVDQLQPSNDDSDGGHRRDDVTMEEDDLTVGCDVNDSVDNEDGQNDSNNDNEADIEAFRNVMSEIIKISESESNRPSPVPVSTVSSQGPPVSASPIRVQDISAPNAPVVLPNPRQSSPFPSQNIFDLVSPSPGQLETIKREVSDPIAPTSANEFLDVQVSRVEAASLSFQISSTSGSATHPVAVQVTPIPETSTIQENETPSFVFDKHLNQYIPVGQQKLEPKTCKECGESVADLEAHAKLVHGIRLGNCLKCADCNVIYLTKDSFNSHGCVKSDPSKKLKFKCADCDGVFETNADYLEHVSTAHNESEPSAEGQNDSNQGLPHACPYPTCKSRFPILQYLKAHMRRVHDRKCAKTCEHCGHVSSTQGHLKYHMAAVHGMGEFWKCEKCKRVYITEEGFEDHVCFPKSRSRSSESQPQSCDQCGAVLKNSKILLIHKRRVHETPDPSERCQCQECGKEFPTKLRLSTHFKAVHEERDRYMCTLCGKLLRSKMDEARHNAAQHGIGDIKCEFEGCPKVFARQKDLEAHVKYVHEGVTPPKSFECRFCDKAFAHQFHLRRHELAIHINKESKPYKCNLCEKSFPLQSYLQRHDRQVHRNIKRKYKPKKTVSRRRKTENSKLPLKNMFC